MQNSGFPNHSVFFAVFVPSPNLSDGGFTFSGGSQATEKGLLLSSFHHHTQPCHSAIPPLHGNTCLLLVSPSMAHRQAALGNSAHGNFFFYGCLLFCATRSMITSYQYKYHGAFSLFSVCAVILGGSVLVWVTLHSILVPSLLSFPHPQTTSSLSGNPLDHLSQNWKLLSDPGLCFPFSHCFPTSNECALLTFSC